MKMLVTGGSGFIGSNFIRYLLDNTNQYSVYNLDKNSYASRGLPGIRAEYKNRCKSFFNHNIAKISDLQKLPKDIDAIINFAAETHVDRSIIDARPFLKSNVEGVYNLLEFARKRGIQRVIHISTDEVYGSCGADSFSEESPILPNNPYSATKAAGDLLIRSYIKTHNFKPIIVRPSNNFGPFQFPEKVIPLFITNILEDIPLPVYGDGKNIREWLYVGDTCKGIKDVLEKGTEGEIYNIGGGNEISNIELVRKIIKLMGRQADESRLIKFVEDRPGHDKRYRLDSSKAQKQFGWNPSVDFDEQLNGVIRWYKDNKNWWKKIRSDRKRFADYYFKQYKKAAK